MITDFTKMLQPILEEAKELIEMDAIWLDHKIFTDKGKQHRITEGMKVAIKDDNILPEGKPTHKILGCFGTLDNSYLFINVIDLDSLRLSRIILKGEKR